MFNKSPFFVLLMILTTFFLYVPYCISHGALADEGSEGWGPFIFIPVIAAFGLFMLFSIKKKGWSILVVGGAGYLGSALVKKLLNNGHRVTVLDKFISGEGGLESVEKNLDLRQIQGDFKDLITLEKALIGCDAIIYLAREVEDENQTTHALTGEHFDAEDIRLLIKKANGVGIQKLIFTSSMSVYGNKGDCLITEEISPEPVSEFSKYLVNCEKIVRGENFDDLHSCIIRPSSIIGPSLNSRASGELNEILIKVINNKTIGVIKGFKSIPYIHIEDITDFYLFVLNQPSPKIDGQVFNAGSGFLSDFDLVQILKQILDRDPCLEIEAADSLKTRKFSFEKMTDNLGFSPRYTAYDGARDLLALDRGD